MAMNCADPADVTDMNTTVKMRTTPPACTHARASTVRHATPSVSTERRTEGGKDGRTCSHEELRGGHADEAGAVLVLADGQVGGESAEAQRRGEGEGDGDPEQAAQNVAPEGGARGGRDGALPVALVREDGPEGAHQVPNSELQSAAAEHRQIAPFLVICHTQRPALPVSLLVLYKWLGAWSHRIRLSVRTFDRHGFRQDSQVVVHVGNRPHGIVVAAVDLARGIHVASVSARESEP